MAPLSHLDSELYLGSLDRARFSWAGREYLGDPALDAGLEERLRALELEPEEYGRELFSAVFPPGSPLLEGLHEAILEAGRESRRLRLRLHLSPALPDRLHALCWELVTDPGRRLALARSPDTAFSRYCAVPLAPGHPAIGRPRLLCVVAAPSNVARFGMAEIRRAEVHRRLEDTFRSLEGAFDVEFLEPPATAGRLRERLHTGGGFHLLHVFGHGLVTSRGSSALVLEDEEGLARFVGEELLAEVFLGDRELRLVTLVACHGGAPSGRDSFSGLAGRLVQRGVPAVLAMRRELSVETAHLLTDHLYRHLAATGRADVAVNETRHQLFLAQPKGLAWSSPILFMRLVDGELWRPAPEAVEAGAGSAAPFAWLPRAELRRLRHPLPWAPAAMLAAALLAGHCPAPSAEAELDLEVSSLSFRLAEGHDVIAGLHLAELAAAGLAAVRAPFPAADGEAPAAAGRAEPDGLLLALLPEARPESHLTLQARPLRKGTRVEVGHDGARSYRLSLRGLDRELTVSFQGDVRLKRLRGAPTALHREHPDTLALYPQGGAVDLDLLFSRFDGAELAADIPIDRLSFAEIVDRQGTDAVRLEEESSILSGVVRLRATGERHALSRREGLGFASIEGALSRLALHEGGIAVGFRGRAAGLERAAPGLAPASLMPSVLDLWLDRPAQRLAHRALGGLAAATLLLALLGPSPRRSADPAPRGPAAGRSPSLNP